MKQQAYEISSLGFLPEKCLDKLPPPYAHLTPLLDNLSCKDVNHFRSLVKALPDYTPDQYPTSNLSLEEKRFIYSILTMIIQKYIWGDGSEKPLGIIPTELGAPLLILSKELGLPPVLTYSGVILYNWSVKDPNQPVNLDNLQVNFKLTEGADYEWFCIIHTAIEAEGGKVMKQLFNLQQEMKNQNNEAIKTTLKQVTEVIVNTHHIMARLYEHCSPQDFWNFRFYFEGTNCPKAFPNGLHVKGFEDQKIKFRGASGGQSTLIQIFDAFFSVDHVGHGADFLEEMRDYMPGAHKKFIEDFLKLPPLKDYINGSGDEELVSLYLEGVDKFTAYRNFHFRLVHDYIFQILKNEGREIELEEKEKDLYKNSETGTGGTDPRVFLQGLISNTRKVKNIFRRRKGTIEEEAKDKTQQQKFKYRIKFDRKKAEDFLISLVIAITGSLIIKSVL